ncbi:hypothetical protein TSEDIMI_10320 [Tenacibaculum sediminilitoris]|uniref:hypothetical protein n=1 Tax=Tenacibaculum sediminilitoris TaxID=1820334 RepID=UPI00389634B9
MKITTLVISFSFFLAPLLTNQTTLTSKDSKDKDSKITICHVPPGNPSNVHSITISEKALKAHLAHGDFFGFCDTGGEPGM